MAQEREQAHPRMLPFAPSFGINVDMRGQTDG